MPKELPGFYYDEEKNRYFPLKGPIPGSSRSSSSASTTNDNKLSTKNTQSTPVCRRIQVRIPKLLCYRELNGDVFGFNRKKYNFMEEFLKIQASQPVVWKYQGTERIGDGALEQINVDIQTTEGQTEVDVLITGSRNGSLSLFEVGKVGQHFDNGVKFIPDRVWPVTEESGGKCSKAPGHIWRPAGASLQLSSNITCIKSCGKRSYAIDDGINIQRALITTLGSETSGGSVCILNLVKPLDFYARTTIRRMIHETASFNCTIWTADCDPKGNQAVIGSNLGAALVNLETGMASWICRSKSDVLAQQFNQLGNVVLCGLRNGAIVAVDVREKREVSPGLIRHRIPHSIIGRHGQNSSKQWFELKGNIDPSLTIYMPSSICCLLSLQSDDQYFLASSMDGSIKLYDHRMTKRGAVQSYEGHWNSHTRLQLGVDEFERFLVAGGEDCNLRIWSIKSGELLLEEKVSDSFFSTVCWQRSESKSCDGGGVWFGSLEGLYYMHWQ